MRRPEGLSVRVLGDLRFPSGFLCSSFARGGTQQQRDFAACPGCRVSLFFPLFFLLPTYKKSSRDSWTENQERVQVEYWAFLLLDRAVLDKEMRITKAKQLLQPGLHSRRAMKLTKQMRLPGTPVPMGCLWSICCPGWRQNGPRCPPDPELLQTGGFCILVSHQPEHPQGRSY